MKVFSVIDANVEVTNHWNNGVTQTECFTVRRYFFRNKPIYKRILNKESFYLFIAGVNRPRAEFN